MRKHTGKKLGAWLLALVMVLALFAALPPRAAAEENDRYITVTLHAGEHGYFGDPSVKEKESVQFRGDLFVEETVPDAADPDFVFMGWATSPDAVDPNVYSEMTNSSMIGTDLYAVWTDECLVYYHVLDGYLVMDDGQQYTGVIMRYSPGERFQALVPTCYDSKNFDFAGWYVGGMGQGSLIDENTIIDIPDMEVACKWRVAEDRVDPIESDVDIPMDVPPGGLIYAFRPEVTAAYEILAKDNSIVDTYASISMIDVDRNVLLSSDVLDPEGNASMYATLEAGKVYYLHFQEMGGYEAQFTARISKAESAAVTFHTGREDTWFGEQGTTEKTIAIHLGEDICKYKEAGLFLSDPKGIEHIGWSVDPDAEAPDEELIVEGDMDVYAVFRKNGNLYLDANGGFFSIGDERDVMTYSYVCGTPFVGRFDPRSSDNRLAFAGWSADPNAAVPDADIVEGVTICDDLPGTLYAVYTEKVVETFDANGGYLLDDPAVTTFQSAKGVGHIFYGLALFHQDYRMVPMGWTDQDGEFIPYTADIWPFYHVKGDTAYTAVWGYKVYLNANGGFFPEAEIDKLAVTMEYEGVFSLDDVIAEIGEAVYDGTGKYFAGWATTPDAVEPDVFDGVTPVKGLDWVYAVWKDDSYVYEEGAGASWTKGSPEGLTFVIKRAGDDRETYPAFNGVSVDGNDLIAESFDAKEGSLILTLKPEYLETLAAGEHELTAHFIDADAVTAFTVLAPDSAGTKTAIWLDGDGSELDRAVWKEGESAPATQKTPVMAEDDEYAYTFAGWDEGTEENGSVTYTPLFRAEKKTAEQTASGAPNTGDESRLPMWIALMAGSALLLAAAAFTGRRLRKNRND